MFKTDWHLRTLFTSSLMVVLVRVAGILLQALIVLYLARTLSLEEMGYFSIAYALLGLARMLGPLGSDQIAIREISNALSQGNLAEAQALSTTSLALVLAANGAFSFICFVALLFLADITALTFLDCLTISLALPSFALNGLFVGQIRAMGKPVLAQLPDSVGSQILLLTGLGGLLCYGQITLSSVLSLLCLASWSVSGVYFHARRRAGLYASEYPVRSAVWILACRGSSISLATIFTGLSVRAPLLLSAPLLGPSATAILEIANRFGTLPSVITNSVASTFSPRFAILAKKNDRSGLYKAYLLAASLSFIPAIVILVFLAALAPPLFGWLLPADYAQAYVPLLIITAASALNGALGITGNILVMADLPHPVRVLSFVRLVAVTVMSVVFGSSHGVLGMACAIFLATALRDGGLAIVAQQKLGSPKASMNGIIQ